MSTREEAMQWWRGLTFEAKCFKIVQSKELIAGYPGRAPDSLTGREIEIIFNKNNK